MPESDVLPRKIRPKMPTLLPRNTSHLRLFARRWGLLGFKGGDGDTKASVKPTIGDPVPSAETLKTVEHKIPVVGKAAGIPWV